MHHPLYNNKDSSPTISPANSSSGEHDDIQETHFSISCKQCRQAHIACDKSMPSCAECTKRGRTCCYETPKKRGRPVLEGNVTFKFHLNKERNSRRGKEKYHPYENLNSCGKMGMDGKLIRDSFKLETIDFYYEYVDQGFDLVSKEEMRRLITKKGNGSNEESIKAMMYSVHALCEQRLANGNIAELSAKEARNSLSKSDYNLYTKISYAILADYLGGEGEDVLALSYLKHLKSIAGVDMTSLKNLIVKAEKSCEPPNSEGSGVLLSLIDVFSSYKPNHTYDLKSIETEGVTPMNAELAVTIVQAIKDLMTELMNPNYSGNFRRWKHEFNELLFVSGVSSIFFALGLDGEKVEELVERAEGIIMELDTLYVPVSIFPFLSMFMSYRVKQFGNIIVDFSEKLLSGMDIRTIFTEEKQHTFYSIILQYSKIMQDYGKRYKRINKYYSKLSNDLALIVKWKFDVQMSTLPSQLNEYQSTPQLSNLQLAFPLADFPQSPLSSDQYLSCLEKERLFNI